MGMCFNLCRQIMLTYIDTAEIQQISFYPSLLLQLIKVSNKKSNMKVS
jgi:hypothetical protein